MRNRISNLTASPPRLLAGIIAVGALCAAFLAPTPAEAANMAANSTLRNTVTVKYQNAAAVQMTDIVRTVDVTISLKQATPTVTLTSAQNVSTDSATAVDFTYTITTNANGPDTYNLTATPTYNANFTGATLAFYTAPNGGGSLITNVTLGASTFVGTSYGSGNFTTLAGANTINILRDNGTFGASVNQIASGDTVLINGTAYPVTAANTASGYGLTTITITAPAGVVFTPGDAIVERQTVYLHVSSPVITPGTTTNQTIPITTTATDGTTPAGTQSPNPDNLTILVPTLTVTKYVRLVGAADCAGGTPVSLNTGGGAHNYCTTGVTGKPGDTLEYAIEIKNAAGGGVANKVVISDSIPFYTTYVAGSMFVQPDSTGAWSAALNDLHNTPDAGEFDTTNKIVYIYAGTGGLDNGGGPFGTGAGGSLAAGKNTYGVFKVTIQ